MSHDQSVFSTPQTSPAPSVQERDSEYFSAPPPPPPDGTLFHRRQRSNTAPSAVLSPLTALSTSMETWKGSVTATAAAVGGLPTFSVTPSEDGYSMPTSSSSCSPMADSSLTDGTVPFGELFSFGSTSSLLCPEPEIDMERTPRRADFLQNVQDQPYYTHHLSMSAPEFSSIHSAYDSYVAGLDDLNISNLPYDLAPTSQSMSPFEELDFNEFLSLDSY